ncbi:hypothetical protein [Hymenobacter lucidus]|uniref:Uncharacterized protein n=1 Tax=Hymenobacter lucidus TaxID=2880930 RepID=A0ABS8AZB4_9BACT|nr:hypothetical protein [Hymenobacter lucidus]MCB2411133.1 hypothetical protein [Hymenobacter lucidus]
MPSSFPETQLPYKSIPYSLASPALQEQALSVIRQVFQSRFSTLTSSQWHQVATACYPVLEVEGMSVEIRSDDFARLATYLFLQHTDTDAPESLAYCSASRHVAYKLAGVSRRAADTLAHVSTLCEAEKPEAIDLYRSVLESVAGGDAIVNSINLAFAFLTDHNPSVRRAYPHPITSSSQEPISSNSQPAKKRVIKELPEQWDHLQAWFKQANDPARPWNVSGIARQLSINQSVVRALLTAPKGTQGYSRTAFSKARLRLLQRYFRSYGYTISSPYSRA